MMAAAPGKRGFEDGGEGLDPAKRQATGAGVGTGDGSNFMFKILVPNKMAGGVIGSRGATINSIKEASGARVKVSRAEETYPGSSDRIILISGTVDGVLTASRLVVAEIFKEPFNKPPREGETPVEPEVPVEQQVQTLTLVVPGASCGLILGKGGETINQLRQQCDSKIILQNKDKVAVPGLDERTVVIHANLLNAQMAVEKIILLFHEDGSTRTIYANPTTNYDFLKGAGMMPGAVPGMPGAPPAAYGAMPGAPPPGAYGVPPPPGAYGQPAPYGVPPPGQMPGPAPGMPGGYPDPYGMQAPAFAAPTAAAPGMPGAPDPTGAQMTMKLSIPDMTVGMLVGNGGSVIKELRGMSGANIKVSQRGDVVPGTTNRIVSIIGTPQAANYAHMLVLQKVPTATMLPQ